MFALYWFWCTFNRLFKINLVDFQKKNLTLSILFNKNAIHTHNIEPQLSQKNGYILMPLRLLEIWYHLNLFLKLRNFIF